MQISKRMEQVLFRVTIARSCLLIAAGILLCACSPKFDWRTVQSAQERYTALFPGKPDRMERKITYQSQELQQTLEAVKIDEDIYSISSIYLSPQQIEILPKLLGSLESNLFGNAGVDQSTAVSSDGSYQTASRQRFAVKDYFLEFKSVGSTQQAMRVRWLIRPALNGGIWLYQVSILHAGSVQTDAKTFFSAEDRANFFDEFHPD
jgi:hypothetical protein